MIHFFIYLIGFMLSALGHVLITVATEMNMWCVERLPSACEEMFFCYGLWNSCVRTTYGRTECKPYITILGLPGKRITRREKETFIEYSSTCWIKENIFQRTLEGTLEYLGGFRADFLHFPPCIKMQSTAEKMVSLRNQMEI